MGEPDRERLAKALIEIVFSDTADANELRMIAMRGLQWSVVPPAAPQRDMQEVGG